MLFFLVQLCPGMDPYPHSIGQYQYFIPNPENCTLSYKCDRYMNQFRQIEYKASLYKCPNNYGFDVNSKLCHRIDSMPCCLRGTAYGFLWPCKKDSQFEFDRPLMFFPTNFIF